MVDILERLRSYADDAADLGAADEAVIVYQAANEIEWLRGERSRLVGELGKAHRDIIPWIEKAGAVAATQEVGKVTVSRELVESVLADAEAYVNVDYHTQGNILDVHPVLRQRYLRDMDDIRKLKAEMGETKGE
jgi:hypothetical protein